MPTPKKKRNYRKEYDTYHAKPQQKKNRAKRNAARSQMVKEGRVKKGDRSREVDHKKSMKKGGGNGRKNLRVVSRRTNRKKGAK